MTDFFLPNPPTDELYQNKFTLKIKIPFWELRLVRVMDGAREGIKVKKLFISYDN